MTISPSNVPPPRLTLAFLHWCDILGSQKAATDRVAIGREAGVLGLPAQGDWSEWEADEMSAAVVYLDRWCLGLKS